jgi:D-glycero-D-manno-heptose 1,7-bisphosphate phosphatase
LAGERVKLVILDRDGVINEDSDAFVKSAAEWQPIEGSIEAIARLRRAGFTVAIATNQSGIGRGLFNRRALYRMHAKLRRLVRLAGADIGLIAYCPHRPGEGCDCRKPAPGLLRRIGRHYGVSLAGVPAVGDSLRDLEAARAVGAAPWLVRTGKGRDTEKVLREMAWRDEVRVADDLAAVARQLTSGRPA